MDRHSLLRRQLKRFFAEGPIPPEWEEFLGAVDSAYREFDTDRRMLERSLELSSHELLDAYSDVRAIFQAIPDRFFRIDFEGRILDYKAGAEADPETSHLSKKSILGATLADILSPSAGPKVREAIEAVRAAKSTVTIEYTLEVGAGFAHYEARLLPLLKDQMIVMVRNISERKNLQAQLVFADRMASVGTVAAGLAHEVNNPLGYVMSNLSYAIKHLDDRVKAGADAEVASVLEALKEAVEGAERVRQIVRDLKTFSRSDDERSETVDVRIVLDRAIKMVRTELAPKAKLIRDYRDVPQVEANQGRLHQVFLNLLLNAAQAIPEGALESNSITVVARTDEARRAVIEIRDTGCGIREADLARVFDPFFTTKPPEVGTGLGLAICHAIVTGLGGAMSVESRWGEGAVFRIVLPPAQRTQLRAHITPVPVRRKGRLLVVDDEEKIGTSLGRALEDDHDVVSVTSAISALDLIGRGEPFDVILCDLMMPEMSGMEFFARLEHMTPVLKDRVVFITAGAFTPTAREFLERVPNRRLMKPIDIRKLRSVLRSFEATSSPPGAA